MNLRRISSKYLTSNWFVLAMFALATTIILSKVFFFRSTFFTNLDNVDQFYSWYQKLATSLHSGEFPLWNANTLGGQSFAGEIQQGVFYPINLVFMWLFGSAEGISHRPLEFLVALHFLLGAFGMYLVLKRIGLRTLSSFCAGLIFVFSGVIPIRAASQTAIFFGLCLVPYPILFLLKYHQDGRRWKWLVACGLALGLIILSGHVQPFFHAALILAVYEASRLVRMRGTPLWGYLRPGLESIRRFALILGTTFLIALPQLWLSYQYIPNAYRVQAEGYTSPKTALDYGHFAKSFNLDPHEAANFIEPDRYIIRDGNNLFLGLLPLAILIVAAILVRKEIQQTAVWKQYSRFINALLLITILAMLGYWTWFAVLLYELPFVRQVRQLGRYSIVFQFALMIVFALCFDAVSRLRLTKKQQYKLLAVAAFLGINFVYLFVLRKHIFGLHFALQTLVVAVGLGAIAMVKKSQLRASALCALLIVTCTVNSLWFLPKTNADVRLPADYELNPTLVQLLEDTYGRYRIEIENDSLPLNIGNAYQFQIVGGYGATIYAPYFEFSHKSNLSQQLKRDMLGVSHIVTNKASGTREVVYKDEQKKVFVEKNPTALTKLFTTKKEGSTDRADYASLDATVEEYDDHYQKYRVALSTEALVIVSEVQYPGWELKIDGKSAGWQPYTLDNIPIFRSFQLESGSHTVEFEYHPFGI